MEILQVILLVVGVGIILYNLALAGANLFRIARYCFATRSLGQYWGTFFKSSFSLNAIFSSIIGLVLAIIVFVIIAPIVIILRITKGSVDDENPSPINYVGAERKLAEGTKFHTNIDSIGFDATDFEAVGDLRVDLMMIMSNILKQREEQGHKPEFKVMEEVKLSDGSSTTLPLVLIDGGRSHPLLPLYTQQNIAEYKALEPRLATAAMDSPIYFSLDAVS